jgi:hypothetical protein
MKIAEIVDFYPDQDSMRTTASADMMQRLAAAFTRSGRVKSHWDVGGLVGEPTTLLSPLSSNPATGEVLPTVPTADDAPNDGISLVRTAAEGPPLDDLVVQSRPGIVPFRR